MLGLKQHARLNTLHPFGACRGMSTLTPSLIKRMRQEDTEHRDLHQQYSAQHKGTRGVQDEQTVCVASKTLLTFGDVGSHRMMHGGMICDTAIYSN